MAIFDLIKELKNACFYGELVIKFSQGKIVLVRKTEDIKITG